MNSRTVLRYMRGARSWALVDCRGIDACSALTLGDFEPPDEFFRGDRNAPPENALIGELWEWRGILCNDAGDDEEDVGEWVRVGMAPAIEESE